MVKRDWPKQNEKKSRHTRESSVHIQHAFVWSPELVVKPHPRRRQVQRYRFDQRPTSRRLCTPLENHLRLRTYLVGEQIYLADIVVASALVYPFKFVLDKEFRKPYSTEVDAISCFDARGFLFAPYLGALFQMRVFMLRKPDKMPSVSDTIKYFKGYKGDNSEGGDHLSIQTYAVNKGDRVLLVDDVRGRHPPRAAGGRLRHGLHLRDMENFRIRVFPVLGTMPALFGQSMAAYVLCDLAGKKINPEAVARLSRDQRNKLYQKLQQREHVLFHEE
ncbi:hypothetical protein PR003_g6183 [Phytophthora rubi]|uniref:Glutathione S-transferase C-terminal domain-containing protein n=1 Tax=Phytophthora rubi TaxID=129364 RepID=A0A6A4FR73_9STRA|nr:hypothetical protein PR003_g6183 [Phytophthora rubi]